MTTQRDTTTAPRYVRRWLGMLAVLWMAAAHPLAEGRGEIRIEDDTGYTLVLSGPGNRIVSLAPNITENLFAVGAGDRIVATVEHSDFPPAALRLPRIGIYTRINRESLAALEPDLVI